MHDDYSADEANRRTKEMCDQGRLDKAIQFYQEWSSYSLEDAQAAVNLLIAGNKPLHPGGWYGQTCDYIHADRILEAKAMFEAYTPRMPKEDVEENIRIIQKEKSKQGSQQQDT